MTDADELSLFDQGAKPVVYGGCGQVQLGEYIGSEYRQPLVARVVHGQHLGEHDLQCRSMGQPLSGWLAHGENLKFGLLSNLLINNNYTLKSPQETASNLKSRPV